LKGIFKSYAKYYDIIYADKDYGKECDFLEEIFKKYLKSKPKTILDCGSGTGGHAILLAKRGYEVTGIDLSEEMINIAKEKASKNNVNVDFHVMNLCNLRLNKKFDACISMFNVIGYITNNNDLLNALSNIREHLKKGALFIFDFWYGPAVLTILPSSRMKIVEKEI
jgi:2-polyprenyl-3-methyl-5-hydroxy-6-metoxy-1,4-benzoquinol methylase